MTDNPKLERLATADIAVTMPDEVYGEIADLVLRLHQRSSRDKGALLSPNHRRTYAERSETEQLGMRSAVHHVLHALLLLDLVELRR